MKLSIRFLLDRYGWDKCIEVFGWNEWMLAEGRADENDLQSVSWEELKQLDESLHICPTCNQVVK